MLTKTELEEYKKAQISTCDVDSLIDIRDIKIDKNKPIYNRISDFIYQIKNPYLFKVGDVAVKVIYNEQGRDFINSFVNSLRVQ